MWLPGIRFCWRGVGSLGMEVGPEAARGDDAGEPLRDAAYAAAKLGVSERMIRELWARRELGAVKVGRHVRFRDADLATYVERHRVEPQR